MYTIFVTSDLVGMHNLFIALHGPQSPFPGIPRGIS
eukprot:XP_001705507.1 Hypothetical protein GL50803_115958 [Giardia lamblia ATCC 50803]